MSEFRDIPFVRSVFHPSDFSPESEHAFAHALRIALARKTAFTILHAGGSKGTWTKFPPVRATLERWGLLEKGSSRSAVFEDLGTRIKKVTVREGKPLDAILDFLDHHPTDLIVVATSGRDGLPRWIRPSVAEAVARKSDTMTLFVPHSARGFISLEDGSVSLQRILVPIDHKPDPRAVLAYCTRAAKAVGPAPVKIILTHIGDSDDVPKPELPEDPAWTWETIHRRGDVVDEIIKAAEEHNVDLIAMATEGRNGVLDALRGSVTEQV
ncbi:MAG: universal stress protein, partial [Candidatus Krumholzibacteria bacterium]|nr:universal stress protein [Candidatus Krumholzibacteria bacterium]